MTRSMVFVCLLSAPLAGACSHPASASQEALEHPHESIQLPTQTPHLNYLKIATVEEAKDIPAMVLTGKVAFDENHTQRVASPVDGRATKLLVEPGDKVKVGQALIELSSPNVGQIQADLQKSLQDLSVTERAVERVHKLQVDGAVSAKEVAQVEADHRKAKADVASVSSRLKSLNITSTDPSVGLALRGQLAGTVVDRNVLLGQEVRADAAVPLMTISNLEVVWVLGDVYEQDIALVKQGTAVSVTVAGYPGVTFPGTVAHLNDVVDPVTHTVKLRCVVPNPEGRLKPEMFAKILLHDVGEMRVVIPSRALLNDTQPPRVVLALEGNTFKLHKVEVGPEVAGRVRVLSGLKPGDKIVTDGAIFLKQEILSQ